MDSLKLTCLRKGGLSAWDRGESSGKDNRKIGSETSHMGTHPCCYSFPQRSEGADEHLKKFKVIILQLLC